MTHWHSLYLSSEATTRISTGLHDHLIAHDYTLYDPFSALPGMSYQHTLKCFIAPAQDGWTRILIDGDAPLFIIDALAEALSQVADCLSVRLERRVSRVHGYRAGQLHDLSRWCAPYADAETITHILNAELFDLPSLAQGQIGNIPINTLPDDIQQLAREVNAHQASTLFDRLSQRLLKAVGWQDTSTLIGDNLDWDSQGGQYIRALMAALGISNWRTPDFSTLRTAYAICKRPTNGIPGDEDARRAVPNALNYQPLYGGKNTSAQHTQEG
ncbi:MAG: hypothetical protein ACFE0Q_05130 [Anaerolineae bacterium]